MTNRRTNGVRAYARKALTPAAVAGVAGLALAPQPAFADEAADNATEVSGVQVEAHQAPRPMSPKYTAQVLDTPRSVTVIPQAVITQTAATSLTDLLRTSPGITFGAGEGGQPLADRPFIRGRPRATTSSSTASAIAAARSARSSTWSRSRSSRVRTAPTTAAARAAARST